MLTKKTDGAAAFAQERLNAVCDIVFTLPVYRDLNMDKEVNYHTFQRLMAERYFEPLERRNAAVAAAQDMVAQSERGELTDEELKRRLAEL